MPSMIATSATFLVNNPIYPPSAFPAMRQITMPPPIPTTSRPALTMFAWSATPPCPDGSLLNSQFMMVYFFPYIRESTVVNGAAALTVTATLRTMQFFPVWIATSIIAQAWMTNIREKVDMNITAWPAWIVTPQEDTNKKQHEKYITDPVYPCCWPQ
jgi:hypothetical protein